MKFIFTLLAMLFAITLCSGQKLTREKNKESKTVKPVNHKVKQKSLNKNTKRIKQSKTVKKTSKKTEVVPSKNTTLLPTEPYKKQVIATYYHDKFNGRKTANGTIFDNTKQTAAHRTLAFGTVVKVINRINGKWIYVTINDRGPVKKTREIDLTRRAFMDITDNPNKGELLVDIEIVKGN